MTHYTPHHIISISNAGGEREARRHHSISVIEMKETRDTIETLLIVFITLKIVDFNDLQVLDYFLLVLIAVYIILELVEKIRRRLGHDGKKS